MILSTAHTPSTVRQLVLTDAQTAADLRAFVARARSADDGAIRLQSAGTTLAAYVCLLRPRQLGEQTPMVLGLRTMKLAESADADVTVSLAAVSDRLARMGDDGIELPLPPVNVTESWAGISPPRSGWTPVTEVPTDLLIRTAKDGVREVAGILPVNPGALIVNNARGAVWGRPIPDSAKEIPAGAAFAGYAVGFWVPGESAAVYEAARWLRISTGHGHILVRPPAGLI
ncbi:hypothetical protein [Arthrobacter sp. CG_A4]|uniref:hypothetical protein n=1 Tax=Arthrobacter sp. CG_A4 TaxID=3071706 RepID=UPI002DFD8895|nr:hypothetical protein [Arthrobacter sp. CG_A4]